MQAGNLLGKVYDKVNDEDAPGPKTSGIAPRDYDQVWGARLRKGRGLPAWREAPLPGVTRPYEVPLPPVPRQAFGPGQNRLQRAFGQTTSGHDRRACGGECCGNRRCSASSPIDRFSYYNLPYAVGWDKCWVTQNFFQIATTPSFDLRCHCGQKTLARDSACIDGPVDGGARGCWRPHPGRD